MISQELEKKLAGWMACPDYSSLCPTCWREYIARFSEALREMERNDSSSLISAIGKSKNPGNWQTGDGWWWIQCELCGHVISVPIVGFKSVTAVVNCKTCGGIIYPLESDEDASSPQALCTCDLIQNIQDLLEFGYKPAHDVRMDGGSIILCRPDGSIVCEEEFGKEIKRLLNS